MENIHISREITVFHGRTAPEEARLAGYGAVIEALSLPMPMPGRLALISYKNRQYRDRSWQVFTSRHLPDNNLYSHLVFALKYEGVNLLFFKKLFEKIPSSEIVSMISGKPTGQYSRKIWFLYEWLMMDALDMPDIQKGNYVKLLDEKTQFAIRGTRSKRHRIINNLPGTRDFCPLVFKTEKLVNYSHARLSEQQNKRLSNVHKDLLQRASAFLLLKDSKASFSIEGESPKSKRAARWGKAIGQAGGNALSKDELIRLQQMVIENTRFVKLGFRHDGGFVGEHDRSTGEPLPEHISARWKDLGQLMSGLIAASHLLEEEEIDPVVAAAMVAFGFVFIHPFQDGNGRIHRYLIHHILARKSFTKQGLIFPVSTSILDYINDYRNVLQQYSQPILDFIDWEQTADNNVKVQNETADFYRYFDATPQAEFLYDCVADTIFNIIPQEVRYLEQYDGFKHFLDDEFEMPDKIVALLVRFLEQNGGKLSKRAREKEFSGLSSSEIETIEKRFADFFYD
ncbi:Fic family protein [Marinilabilia rubra]|uniref:Cell filamentation protein Fic n=1 Tax=Marinilabilia rubra TaxID=2162893 RepID=A0A2U2B4I9_9BACT|nr:Fic family protein [Marinilabilia rubra]PWD97991.1 cell filamentation protein Fic [Marinilabilia rubra]